LVKKLHLAAYLLIPALVLGVLGSLFWSGGDKGVEVLRLSGGLGETVSQTFVVEEGYGYEIKFGRASWSTSGEPSIRIEVYVSGQDQNTVLSLLVRLERTALAYGGSSESLVVPPLPPLIPGSYFLKIMSENVSDWELILKRVNQS
jgi:hypothetical protein